MFCQTELEAKRLQEALLHQEREEVARTKAVVGHETTDVRKQHHRRVQKAYGPEFKTIHFQ